MFRINNKTGGRGIGRVGKIRLEELLSNLVRENGLDQEELIECYQRTVRKLSLDWINLIVSDWLSSIVLKCLDVVEIAILDTAFCNHKHRGLWLKCLERNAVFSSFQNVNWGDQIIHWIVSRNLTFEEIELVLKNETISDAGMFHLAQQCPKLKHLKITSNGQENAIGDQSFQYFAAFCPQLEFLDIRDIQMTNEDMVNIGKTCSELRSITLYPLISEHVSNKGLQGILMNNHKIQHFEFTFYNDRSDVILSYLGKYCPLLETLHLENIVLTTHHIEEFTMNCKMIRLLRFEELGYDTQGSCNKILKFLGIHCPLLEELTLNAADRRESLSEEAMKSLTFGCPLLNTLYISNTVIPALGTTHLVQYCPLLAIVSVWNCDVTDGVLTELGKLKHLKTLMVCNNKEITDAGIATLVRDNHKLEVLNINGCKALTDASLISLSCCAPHLVYIRIGVNSDELTSMGVICLFNKCRKLVDIDDKFVKGKKLVPNVIKVELEKRKIALASTTTATFIR